jgi:hypothetical protein
MSSPQPVVSPGRMQRIADKSQCSGGEAIGYGHGTHPAPHGATTKGDPACRDVKAASQLRGSCSDCLDTNPGWIRSAPSRGATGKLDPFDDDTHPGGGFVNGHQSRMIAPCSGARGEYETSWSGSDHALIMVQQWMWIQELRKEPASTSGGSIRTRNDRPKAVETLLTSPEEDQCTETSWDCPEMRTN